MISLNKSKYSNLKFYAILIFVYTLWGVDPIINNGFYRHFSASALSSHYTFFSALLFVIISAKQFKNFNINYLKYALPISLLGGCAGVVQKIGLQYTTPAKYAFLEHIGCVVVPIIMFLCFKKKPGKMQIIASVLCIVGCMVLTGVLREDATLGAGELLCALAGIMYGVSTALTGQYGSKLDARLMMTMYMGVYFISSVSFATVLNFTEVDGAPLEPFRFPTDPVIIIVAALFGLFSVGVGWLLKFEANKRVDPTTVAVIGPSSAIVTSALSVIIGTDDLTLRFGISAILIVIAAILSGLSDLKEKKASKGAV